MLLPPLAPALAPLCPVTTNGHTVPVWCCVAMYVGLISVVIVVAICDWRSKAFSKLGTKDRLTPMVVPSVAHVMVGVMPSGSV